MTAEQVLASLQSIFAEVLDDESIVLTQETTARDVANWDSLANIQLVVAIEKKFQIRFTAAEVRGFKNVGEMCESIRSKVDKA
jgi:acyl carrier protein